MLATVRDRLSALARQGKSADEAVAAAPTRDFDAKRGSGPTNIAGFVRVSYIGLLRHNA